MAEFLGGALGFYLLFGIPLPVSGVLTAIVTFIIVYLEKYGQRTVEMVIAILIAVICAAYGIEMILAKPDWTKIGIHVLMPLLPNGNAILIAAGMLGATVMPHVIFLHSQLVLSRNGSGSLKEKERHLKMEKIDVIVAMNIAFLVNAAMVIVSAAVFFKEGIIVETIELAHHSLEPLLGALSSGAFAVALLASGFSSSAVGAMAGETVMDGFVDLKLPVNVRRLITMIPAMFVIILGVNPMSALILSQVSLSFALPFAIIPLIILTNRGDIMGKLVNRLPVKIIGYIVASLIILLDMALIYMTIFKI